MSDTKHARALEAAQEAWKKFYAMPEWKARDLSGMEAAIAAYQHAMRQPGPDEVRVRVCVGVLECGYWNAAGQRGNEDWASKVDVDDEEGGTQFRWVEATVPGWQPPGDPVVEGEVVE